MRRLSKSKKGKGAANEDGKETVPDSQEADTQGNGNPVPSDDDEEIFERRGAQNQKKNNKRGRKSVSMKNDDAENENGSEDDVPLSPKVKKGKRARKSNANADEDSDEEKPAKAEVKEEDDKEYEVEKVVDCRMYGGLKQYKVKWKGYDEDQNTWESESDLNCPQIIKEFLAEHPDAFEKAPKVALKSGGSKKHKKAGNSPQPKAKKPAVDPVSEEGGEKVYEVEKVVEVHFKKNGQREFLIRWKGFGPDDDTWEPESNLNCKELIERFMEKLSKAKELTMRELRANPQATNRFTLNTRDTGRRLSGRHTSRQRATYYNAE